MTVGYSLLSVTSDFSFVQMTKDKKKTPLHSFSVLKLHDSKSLELFKVQFKEKQRKGIRFGDGNKFPFHIILFRY